MGSEYDENLADNNFFKQLQAHVDILRNTSENKWILCVPRSGSCDAEKLTEEDILEHILTRDDNSQPRYYTLNHREVNVRNNLLIIKFATGTNTIRILFEEVYYVGKYKYIAWCTDTSLNRKYQSNVSDDIIEIHDLRDCIDLLWTDNLGCITLEKINDLVDSFLVEQKLHHLDMHVQKDLIKNLYEHCLELTLTNDILQAKTKDINFFNNLQLAVETYMQTCLNKKLFNSLCTYTCFTDANFNKIVRNIQDIPLKAFNIDPNFYEFLPVAKYELNKINRSYTTLDKLKCLKCMLNVLSSRKNDKSHPLTTDNLLEIVIFLIIKSSVHNWITNLVFVKEFRFSIKSVCDENDFLITTFQAAIECIKNGELYKKLVDFDLYCSSDYSNCNIKSLFRNVCEGNLEKVADAIINQDNNSNLKLCHPLCSCDKCENLLIESNACEVNSCDDRGLTALHFACKFDHLNIIDFLIQKGADINRSDCSGCTPLYSAVSKGQQQAALLLLHSGADADISDSEGNNVLHVAVRNGHENCVKVLIYSLIGRHKLKIDCTNNAGDTPLHFASKFGYLSLVKLLIQHGARIKRNKRNMTPNEVAHNDSVIALLAYAIIETDQEVQVKGRRSSLQEKFKTAVERKTFDEPHTMKKWSSFSLDHDSNISRRNFVNFGVRPKNLDHFKKADLLMKAIENNDLPLTCFYLGIPLPNITSDFNSSCHPLCICEKCSENIPESPGAAALKQTDNLNVNICNSEGFTPVHVAAKFGRLEILRLLLDIGALINLKTYNTFYTPLHLACINQRMNIVRELLKCGSCNLDVPDSEGNTPLHYACCKNDVRMFDLLLSQGADVSIKNNCGKTVLNEAEGRMFFNIVKILKEQDLKHSDTKAFDLLQF